MRLFLFIICCFFSTAIFSQEVDVILIGGQSNATGQGYVSNIPRSFETDTTVYIYYSRYLNNGKNGDRWLPLCPASESEDKFGVELSLGTLLHDRLPKRNIAIIKHALSGSNLYEQWNPGNREGEKRGDEYAKFIHTVEEGLNALKGKGYLPVIRAMVWQQGEADARDIAGIGNSKRYGNNLRNLIIQIRNDLHCPDMLFVYGQVIPLEAPRFPGRELIRTAQILVSEKAGSDLSVRNSFFVETDDLQMRSSDYRTPFPEDDVHLGTYGILMLGERFAKAISTEMSK